MRSQVPGHSANWKMERGHSGKRALERKRSQQRALCRETNCNRVVDRNKNFCRGATADLRAVQWRPMLRYENVPAGSFCRFAANRLHPTTTPKGELHLFNFAIPDTKPNGFAGLLCATRKNSPGLPLKYENGEAGGEKTTSPCSELQRGPCKHPRNYSCTR